MSSISNFANMARYAGNASCRSGLLAFNLIAHGVDGMRVRADKDDPLIRTTLRKLNLLRQEAKAWVNSLRASLFDGGDDLVDHQIGFRSWGWADEDLFVGHLYGHGIAVGFGKHDDGFHTHPAACLDDTNGHFAAIGNQNLIKHLGPRAPRAISLLPGFIMSGTG